ncbi:MAG: hypothetical protein ACOCQQ_00010 [Candidatus Nanoarchaeia archaeon]
MEHIKQDLKILDKEFKNVFEIEKKEHEQEFLRTANVGIQRVISKNIYSGKELIKFLEDANHRIHEAHQNDEDFKYKELGVALGECIGVLEVMIKRGWQEKFYNECVKWFAEIKKTLNKHEHHVSTKAIEKRVLQLVRQHNELRPELKNALKQIAKLYAK